MGPHRLTDRTRCCGRLPTAGLQTIDRLALLYLTATRPGFPTVYPRSWGARLPEPVPAAPCFLLPDEAIFDVHRRCDGTAVFLRGQKLNALRCAQCFLVKPPTQA